MSFRRFLAFALAGIGGTLPNASTALSGSGSFELRRLAMSGAAVTESAGSFALRGTLGEAGIVGLAVGGSYSVGKGFWSNMYRILATDTPEILSLKPQLVNSVSPSFPNPFRDATSIIYSVASTSRVKLSVFDVTGRRVALLVDQEHSPGHYRASWSGRDESGALVASGVYFCRIDIGAWSRDRKMLAVR